MTEISQQLNLDRFYDKLDIGILILDGDLNVRYANHWIRHHLPGKLEGKANLAELFQNLRTEYIKNLASSAIKSKSYRVLSQTFHKWIIPLPDKRMPDGLMRQGCSIIPFESVETGETFALLQIRDDSDRVLQIGKLNNEKTITDKINSQLHREIKERVEAEQRLLATNEELKKARLSLEEKAIALEQSSKFKSEFLANMSHELRTPLNAMLLLSKILADNKEKNLTEEQQSFAQILHNSGNDLLSLINEILDLAKVEAGKMEINPDTCFIDDLKNSFWRTFENVAREKNIDFRIDVEQHLPKSIVTDEQRLTQIIRNLLSNAFKFTRSGSVSLSIHPAEETARFYQPSLKKGESIAFSVSDTGIGIPDDKLENIFQAFQQADGSISRKYGGTGLGLSISREFTKLLKGEVQVKSDVGKGSVFTLYLPFTIDEQGTKSQKPDTGQQNEIVAKHHQNKNKAIAEKEEYDDSYHVADDRRDLSREDSTVLIIEEAFEPGKIINDFSKIQGYKVMMADTAQEGLYLSIRHRPAAIIVDIDTPDPSGWHALLRIKYLDKQEKVPFFFFSLPGHSREETAENCICYVGKTSGENPLEPLLNRLGELKHKQVSRIVVFNNDPTLSFCLDYLNGLAGIDVEFAPSLETVFDLYASKPFDCLLVLEKPSSAEIVRFFSIFAQRTQAERFPVFIATHGSGGFRSRGLSRDISEKPDRVTGILHHLIIETETIFNEIAYCEFSQPDAEDAKSLLAEFESRLQGRTVLLIDDDMRNVFSLKKILEEHGMNVLVGANGVKGLAQLEKNPDIDLILLDIMLPEMDGFETMRRIRNREPHDQIPIIAITAKAMRGDRARCIEAGASDYLKKPVDIDLLIPMVLAWI